MLYYARWAGDDRDLLGTLTGLTATFSVISAVSFHWFEYRARELGLIDMLTNY